MVSRPLNAVDANNVEIFFATCDKLNRSEFKVEYAKHGNVKICWKRHQGQMVVLAPMTGRVMTTSSQIAAAAGYSPSSKFPEVFCAPPRALSKAELDAIEDAAREMLNGEEYGAFVKSFDISLDETGTDATVIFIPYAASLMELRPVKLSASFKEDIPSLQSRMTESAELSPREMAYERAARSISKYIGKLRKKLARELESVASDGKKPFMRVLRKKDVKSMTSLAEQSGDIGAEALQYDGQGFIWSSQSLKIRCKVDGSSPSLSPTSREALGRYSAAFGKARSIEEILDYATGLAGGGLSLSSASYDGEAGEMSLFVSGAGKYTCVVAIPGSFKRQLKEFFRECREAEAVDRRRRCSKFAGSFIAGDIVAMAAAKVIAANDDFITENRVVKILRGLKTDQYTELVKTAYDGKFNLIADEDVHRSVSSLVEHGLAWRKWVSGKYTDYYILKPTEDLPAFIELAQDPAFHRELADDGAWELETVRIARYAALPDEKTVGDDVDYLLEHPALWCLDSKAIDRWLADLPSEYKEYLKLRYKLEDDRKVRKYLKQLVAAANGDKSAGGQTAAKKKPLTDGKSHRICSVKAAEFEAVKSTALSSPRDERFVVVEVASGDIVDDAQGYGYKTPDRAMSAWRYKQKHRHHA